LQASSTIRFGNAGVTSQFIWDSSTGRLGVGTTTPTSLFGLQKPYGYNGGNLFTIASSTAANGSSALALFSVDTTGITTVGNTAGTGDAVFQLASDTNAWSLGYSATDKTFRIASSTNLSANVYFQIGKSGTTTLNSGITDSNAGQYLCISGTTFEIMRNTSSCTPSSERFKDNIKDLSYGLDAVMKLHAVSYTYKPELGSGTSTRLGFIAEEVELVIPELVTYDNAGLARGLDYPTITAVLASAIQEININLMTIASSTYASSTPSSEEFAEGFFAGLFDRIIAWFADTANGIQTFFAKEIKTEQLCIKKADGSDVCVTGDQLANLLAGGGGDSSGSSGGNESTHEPEPEPAATSTPPTPEPEPVVEEPVGEDPPVEEPAEEVPAAEEPAAEDQIPEQESEPAAETPVETSSES
jgi:hypothetical protein